MPLSSSYSAVLHTASQGIIVEKLLAALSVEDVILAEGWTGLVPDIYKCLANNHVSLITKCSIEDITGPRVDTNFIFEC